MASSEVAVNAVAPADPMQLTVGRWITILLHFNLQYRSWRKRHCYQWKPSSIGTKLVLSANCIDVGAADSWVLTVTAQVARAAAASAVAVTRKALEDFAHANMKGSPQK
jgi:hypothetical protein